MPGTTNIKGIEIITVCTMILIASGVYFLNQAKGNQIKSDRGTIQSDVARFNEYKVMVFHPSDCGCCTRYVVELRRQHFEVEVVITENMTSIQKKYNVPQSMQSCHTAVIGDYFLEGHVPFEAIRKLLEEKPHIDGIALPRMHSGSPGMPGPQREPFTIYQVLEGEYSEFMIIGVEKTPVQENIDEIEAEKTGVEKNIDAQRIEFISQKEAIIKKLIAQGEYQCCLKKPCISCIEESPDHGQGITCKCMRDVVNWNSPCGECMGEILEGRGNPYLVQYFAIALADQIGEQYLDTLKQIISEKYGISIREQLPGT